MESETDSEEARCYNNILLIFQQVYPHRNYSEVVITTYYQTKDSKSEDIILWTSGDICGAVKYVGKACTACF